MKQNSLSAAAMGASVNPLDGRLAFHSLGRAVDRLVSQRSGAVWHCERAVPRIDGTVYFDLLSPLGRQRVGWLEPIAPGRSTRPQLSSEIQPAPALPEGLTQSLGHLLGMLERDPAQPLLGFYNRDRTRLVFDDAVADTLLAGRFTAGETSWFGYVFEAIHQPQAELLHFTFSSANGPIHFDLRAAGHAPPPEFGERLIDNRIFALDLVADPRDPQQRTRMDHQVERFLGYLLSRSVHQHLRLDPATRSQRPSRPADHPDTAHRDTAPNGDDADRPGHRTSDQGAPVSTTRWGNPLQWYQFFSDFEVERSGLCGVRFTDPIAYIVHGEMECHGIEPNTFGKRVDFVNSPWPQTQDIGTPGSASHFTGLVDQDAIMGGTAKLERALQLSVQNPDVRLICLNNTCLPKIIGDDVVSAVKRAQAQTEVPILSMNTDLNSPDAAYLDLVRQAKDMVQGRGDLTRNGGLNLIGFPPGRGRREVCEQLQSIDVAVNVTLIPEFGARDLIRYMAGRAGILYPNRSWIELTTRVLRDLGVPYQVVPAPYGLKRSHDWFERAAELMEQEGAHARWRDRWFVPFQAKFEELGREAKAHRLALVVDEGQSLHRLIEPETLYGFELAPLLEEMGFSLDILVRRPEAYQAAPAEIVSALDDPDRHRFTSFSSPEELTQLLHDGEFKAVYSEVFFDSRVTRAGKAQFHLGMLEMGIPGALRSLRRLIDLCRWPFYARYGSYLEQGTAE